MKTTLFSAFFLCAPLFAEVAPELSPVPAGVSEKLIAAYADAAGVRFDFQMNTPKKWTLIRVLDPNAGKTKQGASELKCIKKEDVWKLSFNIPRPITERDDDYLFDRTLRLSLGDKVESLSYALQPATNLNIELGGVTYTFTAMKNHALQLTSSSGKMQDVPDFRFEPKAPKSVLSMAGSYFYYFEDAHPTTVLLDQWENTITCDYRLIYNLKIGSFTFMKVPLEGEAASNIQFVFDGRASFSTQQEDGASFRLKVPKGYEMNLPFSSMTIPAYSVGKEGKLDSLAAKLSVNSAVFAGEDSVYFLNVSFAHYPEGREIMVDGSVPIEIWKVGDPSSKQSMKTPLRFRFKPHSVEKVKAIQAP